MKHARQGGDQRIKWPHVAADGAAHDRRKPTFAWRQSRWPLRAVIRDADRQLVNLRFVIPRNVRLGSHARSAGNHVRIAEWKQHDVSCTQPNRRLAHDARPAIARGDDVVLNDVLGAGHHCWRDVLRGGRFGRPLAPPAYVKEHSASQSHSPATRRTTCPGSSWSPARVVIMSRGRASKSPSTHPADKDRRANLDDTG